MCARILGNWVIPSGRGRSRCCRRPSRIPQADAPPATTGIQWNALPRSIGAWERDGCFTRLWAAGLAEFDELVGIEWDWLSVDGAMTNTPFGVAATAGAEGIGHNPTDRGKHGTKRSTLSEGHGLPLAVVSAGDNRTEPTALSQPHRHEAAGGDPGCAGH